MERCVVAPAKENVDLLKLASDIALAALNREGWQSGDALVFLPGWQEMLTVQGLLMKGRPTLNVLLLHSETIGTEDEEPLE